MKKSVSTFFIFLSLLIFTSCGKEKLTPMVASKTINELKSDQPINFSYKVNATEIEEFARNTGKFPVFGKLFQSIAFVLANSSIFNRGGKVLDLEPIEVELTTSMDEDDFSNIEWMRLDSLILQIDNAKKKDSLDFIEKIDVYALLDNGFENLELDGIQKVKLVSFDKKINDLGCEGKCLNLVIEKLNWKELIKNYPTIKLQPKIVINSVPKSTMALAGSVSFSIKFDLGF